MNYNFATYARTPLNDYITSLDDARVILKKSEFNKVVKEIFKNFFHHRFINNFDDNKSRVANPQNTIQDISNNTPAKGRSRSTSVAGRLGTPSARPRKRLEKLEDDFD